MKMRAIAYLRTSSAANVEGDSPFRQNDAIMMFADRSGVEVVSCYWDAAVSGADPIEARPGFVALLHQCAADDVSTVIVEDPSRFARSVLAQELGVLLLGRRGIRLLTSRGEDMTDASNPAANAHRQMAGLMAEYEKATIVRRLALARERVRREQGACEGRKSHADLRPEIVQEVRRLARRSPKTGRKRSARQIASELAAIGYTTAGGRPLSHTTVLALLAPIHG